MTELVILTGASGSGKTLAMQCFEDAGYFITDNIPVDVVDEYLNCIEREPDKYKKVALSVSLENAGKTFELARKHTGFQMQFVGMTCSEDVLLQRYRLTRKTHPKQIKGFTLQVCVQQDIIDVRSLRDYFDVFIDTTKLSKNDFRSIIYDTCIGANHKFTLSFFSFGYKISIPQDIETVFDVRLLPNPYWIPELKELTGLDKPVKDYVLNSPEAKEYLKHVITYLEYYIAELRKNNRNHAVIGIACSGGQHRSVVVAEYLANYFSDKYHTTVNHKDLPR